MKLAVPNIDNLTSKEKRTNFLASSLDYNETLQGYNERQEKERIEKQTESEPAKLDKKQPKNNAK